MLDTDKTKWCGPNWNAYVAAGKDRTDRKARLEEVPEELKAGVIVHVKTVVSLANWHRRMAEKKAKRVR